MSKIEPSENVFHLLQYIPQDKKECHEIKDTGKPLVKATEKDSTPAPRLVRKRKLRRQITKFVENIKQMDRVEEEEWLSIKSGTLLTYD